MRKTAKIVGVSWAFLFLLFAAIPARPQCDGDKGDVHVTASGLKYKILKRGDGAKAERGKEIALHGIGTFEDGRVFWNSRESGTPFFFVLGKDWVIKGCEEGVALMRVGDRFLFIMTPELGYGEKGKGDVIPPNAALIFDYEILSVEDPKISLADTLYQTVQDKGIGQAVELYERLKKENGQNYNFREDQLNVLGYKLLGEGKTKEAITVLELNVSAYPESFNVYDSLAEAYMKDGQKAAALENFRKSLELNPKNDNAAGMIKKLQEENRGTQYPLTLFQGQFLF